MALLTAVVIFADHVLHGALVLLRDALRLERRRTHVRVPVQVLLQAVVLPAEEVVSVGGVSGAVTAAPYEWLATIRWPIGLVVELPGVPYSLQKDLRQTDRVRLGAGAS